MAVVHYYSAKDYKHRNKQDPRDVFHFEGASLHGFQEYWLDKHGNRIPRESHDKFPQNVEFVVTEDGEVLATSVPEWGIATFVHPETKLPDSQTIRPVRFFLEQGKTHVEYEWLKCDEDVQYINRALFMPDLLLDENSSLPLTSFDGHLRHYSEIDMPSSSKTLPVLRRWLRGREHREVGCWTACKTNKPNFVGVDVYDALELAEHETLETSFDETPSGMQFLLQTKHRGVSHKMERTGLGV